MESETQFVVCRLVHGGVQQSLEVHGAHCQTKHAHNEPLKPTYLERRRGHYACSRHTGTELRILAEALRVEAAKAGVPVTDDCYRCGGSGLFPVREDVSEEERLFRWFRPGFYSAPPSL